MRPALGLLLPLALFGAFSFPLPARAAPAPAPVPVPAPASDAAPLCANGAVKQLSEILDLKKKADSAPAGGMLHVGRIVALDRPNALVIVATRGSYERILRILGEIDVAPSNESQVRVVMLQHADAKKIVGPINEAIGGGAPAAAGPTGARTSGAPNAPAAVLEASAKVSADETTNALIVTATARDYGPIKAVIDALDRPKRQVFIEAVVLDVSAEHGLDLGIAFHGGSVNPSALKAGNQTTYGGFRPLTSAGPPSNTELQASQQGPGARQTWAARSPTTSGRSARASK
jgi:general secretion pathway protein D